VTANPDGTWPPTSVLHFLLQAVTQPGDSIILPNGGPVDRILEVSRRPICFDVDKEQYEKNVEMVKKYYNNIYRNNVEFR